MAWNSIGIPNVPKLPRNVGGALIKFGGAALINAVFGNYWGIFGQNGIPLLLSDNVTSVRHQNTSQVSNAPVAEQEAALQAALAAGNTEAAKTAEHEIANYRGMLGSK